MHRLYPSFLIISVCTFANGSRRVSASVTGPLETVRQQQRQSGKRAAGLCHGLCHRRRRYFICVFYPPYIFSPTREKGQEWREFYLVVHNFAKAYPYALQARVRLDKADSILASESLLRAKKSSSWLNGAELFAV